MSQVHPLSGDPPRSPSSAVRLRPASQDDIHAVVDIWHAGWRDAHLGKVPDELVEHRTIADLIRLARERMATTILAIHGDHVGFVAAGSEREPAGADESG